MVNKRGGRTSAAAREAALVAQLVPGEYPKPPKNLSAEEAEIWDRIVATKPHDWFQPDTYDLLSELCKHTTTLRKLNERVEKELDFLLDTDVKHADKLLAMRDRESKRIETLMRSMRLTQQSRWQAKTAGGKADNPNKPKGRMPWQNES